VTIGDAVQQNGFPLLAQALSGNTSDAVWFRDALQETIKLFQGDLASRPIFAFDAASNGQMFPLASDSKTLCIIRLSNSFHIADECVMQAWENDIWQEAGKFAENAKASTYKIAVFSDTQLGSGWRAAVVHSTGLQASKEKQIEKILGQEKS
jgi:hypothetical protein